MENDQNNQGVNLNIVGENTRYLPSGDITSSARQVTNNMSLIYEMADDETRNAISRRTRPILESINENQSSPNMSIQTINDLSEILQPLSTSYVTCTLLDPPDDLLLKNPVSKICGYFEGQLAIFYSITSFFTTVDMITLAIKNTKHLCSSYMKPGSLVVDAGCDRHAKTDDEKLLFFAFYNPCMDKTVVLSGLTPTSYSAKTCYMVWNEAKKEFVEKISVMRSVMRVYGSDIVTILTDEGLADFKISQIKYIGYPYKPAYAINLLDTLHCLQDFDIYRRPDANIYVVLTDKGMIQYVERNSEEMEFKISNTAQMIESLTLNAVFSAIKFIGSRFEQAPSVVVAGFDVVRQANMLILLDEKGDRLSKLDAIVRDDSLPIVELRGYHDEEVNIKFVISRSTRSVYMHYLKADCRLKQIFDRSMDGLEINGVHIEYWGGDIIKLIVYGQRDTRGDIVHMKLDLNVDEIRKLN